MKNPKDEERGKSRGFQEAVWSDRLSPSGRAQSRWCLEPSHNPESDSFTLDVRVPPQRTRRTATSRRKRTITSPELGRRVVLRRPAAGAGLWTQWIERPSGFEVVVLYAGCRAADQMAIRGRSTR